MKIIHTADWHIYDGHKYSIDGSKLNDIFRNIMLIFTYAVELSKKSNEKVLILIAGDIFHYHNPNENLLRIFSQVCRYAIDNGLILRFITGNHDTNGINFSFESIKHIFKSKKVDGELLPMKIFPLTDKKITVYIEKISNVNFVYVPWQNNLSKALELAKLKREKNCKNILVTHCCVDGAVTNSGYEMKKQKITQKTLSGWDYVALGDFHKNQNITENIWYSGSLVKMVWDERNDGKYFNVFDTNKLTEIKRLKLPDSNFIQIELKYCEIKEFIKNKIVEYNGKKIDGSFIKLIIKGKTNFGENISDVKRHLLECGAVMVNEKIITDERTENNNTESIDLELNIFDACIKYLKNSLDVDKKDEYEMYINKKIMECI